MFVYAIRMTSCFCFVLQFFIGYSNEAVESLWSIDQYFEFVLVLLFSTGLSFQVPVIQLLLGQSGIVSSKQMLSIWKYVVVGSVVERAKRWGRFRFRGKRDGGSPGAATHLHGLVRDRLPDEELYAVP